jgi:multiple sugar transport system permease protein
MPALSDVGQAYLLQNSYRARSDSMSDSQETKGKSKVVKYNKWGYYFLIPFVLVYVAFQLVPLISTIYNSFFENYRDGIIQVGPNFVGLANYAEILSDPDLLKYTGNTIIMWVIGFVPQIIISLILGQWFSDVRLKLRCSGFFKTVIYLPNLIMASAFAMLFFTLFSRSGPINSMLINMGILSEPFDFFSNVTASRSLVGFMNFLMWFGNTTILLMAGIMGIDVSLFEAAEVDGANAVQRFTKITLPLLKPILIYVVITSMIGGIQMFDVPQILTNGDGSPVQSTMTLIMYLNKHLYSKNYGLGGALSVFLFIITGILSLVVYSFMYRKKEN